MRSRDDSAFCFGVFSTGTLFTRWWTGASSRASSSPATGPRSTHLPAPGNPVRELLEPLPYSLPSNMHTHSLRALTEKLLPSRPPVGLNFIDHVVGNQPDLQMEPIAQWYAPGVYITHVTQLLHAASGKDK